jgi:hypothetical protein
MPRSQTDVIRPPQMGACRFAPRPGGAGLYNTIHLALSTTRGSPRPENRGDEP